MLYWVQQGLGLSTGSVGLEDGLLGEQKAGHVIGLAVLWDLEQERWLKIKKKVNGLGSIKSSQLVSNLFQVIHNWLPPLLWCQYLLQH